MEHSESRKLLSGLSEGNPTSELASQRQLWAQLSAADEAATAQGGRVMRVGIQSDTVGQFYPDWIRVDALGELPEVLLERVGASLGA